MINIARPCIGEEEKKAVLDVLDSGIIASGSVVNEFQKEFAEYIGVSDCIATTNGTTALETALRALGIGPGDKVLTTPFSFIASTNCIVYCGAQPVFADIDPRTFNISAESIEKALKEHPDIKALLIVHLFGLPCDMDEIMPIVKKNHLLLIEDCAQSHGAKWKDKKAGSFGDCGCFSFYPTKNMTTSEGGAIVTSNPDIAKRCRMLINHGMEKRYYHDMVGYNYRMTDICAAIGRCQLRKLDEFNTQRRKNAQYYHDHIANPLITLPHVPDGAFHVYHQYTLRVDQGYRDALIKLFQEKGIGYGIFYPLTIAEQKCYQSFGFPTDWRTADIVKKEVISIPAHPSLKDEEIAEVANVIHSFKG